MKTLICLGKSCFSLSAVATESFRCVPRALLVIVRVYRLSGEALAELSILLKQRTAQLSFS